MNNKKIYLLRLTLPASDFVIHNLSYSIAYLFLTPGFNHTSVYFRLLLLGIFNATWMVFAAVFRLYAYTTLLRVEMIYRSTWRMLAAEILVFISIIYLLLPQQFYINFLAGCFGIVAVLLLLHRLLLTYITEFVFKKIVSKRKVLIVGDNTSGKQLADYFINNKNFYSLAGIFDNKSTAHHNKLYKGRVEACVDFAAKHQVNYIYSTILPDEDERILALRDVAENKCIHMLFVAKDKAFSKSTYYRVNYIGTMPVLSLRAEPLLKQRNMLRKRVFDVAFSTVVILFLLSWLTPLLAVLIKLTSKGPIFFVQQRSGKDNQPFECYKFRSMQVNESSNDKQATKGDNRITAIGSFIRKTSIDELPQFFNVWLGSMSIVGPRPHMLKHTEQYSAIIDKYLMRHYLKPGITGWAQVNGYRGETADVSLMEKRVAYDIEYMESWSLMQDVKIVFMTIINIFKGEEWAR